MSSFASTALAVTAATILFAPAAHAQDDASSLVDSLRPVVIVDDATTEGMTLYYSVGVTPIGDDELNASLAAAGIEGRRFRDDLLGGYAFLGVGSHLALGPVHFGAEFAYLPRTGSSLAGVDVDLGVWSATAMVGYDLLADPGLSLWPYVGIGTRHHSLSIDESRANSFSQLFDSSAGRSVGLSSTSGHIEIGLGAEVAIPIREDESTRRDATLGLRAAYLGGLLFDEWRSSASTRSIAGGPDISPSGLQLTLYVGVRIRPRVYDARIIAERDADGGLDTTGLGAARTPVVPAPAAELASGDGLPVDRTMYGFKGGWNRARTDHAQTDDQTSSGAFTGSWPTVHDTYQIGAFASIPIHGSLGLQTELLYSQKGGGWYTSSINQIMSGADWDTVYTLTTRHLFDYLELPVVAKLSVALGRSFALTTLLGAYLATPLSASIEYEREYSEVIGSPPRAGYTRTTSVEPDLEPLELGGVIGFGFDIAAWSTVISLELRATLAFGDASTSHSGLRNRVASIVGGIAF